MQKLTEWAKTNPKLAAAVLAIVCTALGNLTGWTFAARAANAGEKPGIVVVLPEDFGDVFRAEAGVFGDNDSPSAGQRAMRAAGNHLRRNRGEREPFFVMLRELHNNPDSLAKYEQQSADASKFDPVTASIAVKIAVKIAIAVLERTAPESRTPWDDRLLKLLQAFDVLPFLIQT